MQGGMKMAPGGGGFGGLGAGGGKEDSKKTKNGLSADRYAEDPKPELRRVPFGISLIVGQEHIDRVLYAFSKSRLRILMTQVIINRYPHSVRPSGVEQQAGGGRVNPGGASGGVPSFLGGGMGIKGFMSGGAAGGFASGGFASGGFASPSGTSPIGAAGDSQETNLELVIYGIATLYQRYPPRPPEAGQQSP
jgi:hypothetical protein